MSVSKPGLLTVRSDSTGALVLTGELDVATIQRLQDKSDEIVVPGQPIVLDLADLTFLDTSGMHCSSRPSKDRPSRRPAERVTFTW